MDVQDQSTDTTVVDTQVPVSTAVTPEVTTTTPDITQAAAIPAEIPAYQPNFKYKVRDKEFEIDEDVRPLIKDKESEAKWRRMYEKANGLDFVVQDKEALNKQYQDYKKDIDPVISTVREAFDHYQRGDKELAFQRLGIKDEDLYKYVYDKLQKQDLPADQRAAIEKATQLERENLNLKSQSEQFQSQFNRQLIDQREQQLSTHLSQPEINSIAQNYDQTNGQGAFRNLVVMVARQHLDQTKQDLSVGDAVARTAKMFQLSQPQAPSPAQNQVLAPSGVPVIPVARGGGVSTVKKKVSSIEDIEKEYQLYGKV